MNKNPVIIIGSGLAGLACAVRLKRKGVSVLVLEKEAHVGGRVRTIRTGDGFLLDVGFQVLLDSYPELSGVVDLKPLQLKKFNSGSLIMSRENDQLKFNLLANPLVHPVLALKGMFLNKVAFSDQVLVLKLISGAYFQRKTLKQPISTMDFLSNFGFTAQFIDFFWRPFLTGVFLDPNLSLDSDYFLFLLRNFSSGAVSIPQSGMAMIPQQMAEAIGAESLKLSAEVTHFDKNNVQLKSGEIHHASAVVCAFNRSTDPRDFLGVKTHYFATDQNLPWGKWLVLVPKKMGLRINQLVVLNHVSAEYSQSGKNLLSVSEVGTLSDPEEIKLEVLKLLTEPVRLDWVDSFHVGRALPKLQRNAPGFELSNGVYYCGDQLSTPSINGALQSGRLVSEEILRKDGK